MNRMGMTALMTATSWNVKEIPFGFSIPRNNEAEIAFYYFYYRLVLLQMLHKKSDTDINKSVILDDLNIKAGFVQLWNEPDVAWYLNWNSQRLHVQVEVRIENSHRCWLKEEDQFDPDLKNYSVLKTIINFTSDLSYRGTWDHYFRHLICETNRRLEISLLL